MTNFGGSTPPPQPPITVHKEGIQLNAVAKDQLIILQRFFNSLSLPQQQKTVTEIYLAFETRQLTMMPNTYRTRSEDVLHLVLILTEYSLSKNSTTWFGRRTTAVFPGRPTGCRPANPGTDRWRPRGLPRRLLPVAVVLTGAHGSTSRTGDRRQRR